MKNNLNELDCTMCNEYIIHKVDYACPKHKEDMNELLMEQYENDSYKWGEEKMLQDIAENDSWRSESQ